jgi:hypothetical protein
LNIECSWNKQLFAAYQVFGLAFAKVLDGKIEQFTIHFVLKFKVLPKGIACWAL